MNPIGVLVKLQYLKEILVSRFQPLFMAEPLKGSALRFLGDPVYFVLFS